MTQGVNNRSSLSGVSVPWLRSRERSVQQTPLAESAGFRGQRRPSTAKSGLSLQVLICHGLKAVGALCASAEECGRRKRRHGSAHRGPRGAAKAEPWAGARSPARAPGAQCAKLPHSGPWGGFFQPDSGHHPLALLAAATGVGSCGPCEAGQDGWALWRERRGFGEVAGWGLGER